MTTETTETRKYRLTSEECAEWDQNGYIVRHNVFSAVERIPIRCIRSNDVVAY